MNQAHYSPDEMMTVATSSYMNDGQTLFIGTGLPMVAAYLAKATHAPDAALLFESGVLDPEPKHIAKAVGDPRLMSTARRVSGMLDTLLLLHGGRVDLGVLGCAQIDRFGNINTTVVAGSGYVRPGTRLPGSGGANDIASQAKRFITVTRHNSRTFVDRVDYVTSPGFLEGPGSRERAGLGGGGPLAVVTDKCVFEFDDASKEMVLKSIHAGIDLNELVDSTGFSFEIPADLQITREPEPHQLDLLRNRIDPDGVYL